MAAHDPDDFIECRTYTHARRFPLVIGQIGGYYLPVPWTVAQLVVALVSFLALLSTRRLWAHFGVVMNIIVLIGVPMTLSWLTRHLKIEGRTTARALAAFGRYLSRSRTGSLHGRPIRKPVARTHPPAQIFVVQTIGGDPVTPAAEPAVRRWWRR